MVENEKWNLLTSSEALRHFSYSMARKIGLIMVYEAS